jgi:hypothetical protein
MRFPRLSSAVVALAAAVSLLACGRTDLESELLFDAGGPDVTTEAGPDATFDTGFPDVMLDDGFSFDTGDAFAEGDAPFDAPSDSSDDASPCGDGRCDDGETCTTCPLDCGFCPMCGDGTCNPGETCSSCPQDCGSCSNCGTGFCNDGKNCISCPQDCGTCQTCGDGHCTGTENCTNCPADCGECPGCGDGHCSQNETCVSCPQDCGSCAVCGNGVCNDGETCVNCPQDCGACQLMDCEQALLCAFACFQGGLANLSLTCVTDCDAEGCPSSQVFLNDATECAVKAFVDGTCGGGGGDALTCIESTCASEIMACFAEPPCAPTPP